MRNTNPANDMEKKRARDERRGDCCALLCKLSFPLNGWFDTCLFWLVITLIAGVKFRISDATILWLVLYTAWKCHKACRLHKLKTAC